MYSVSMETRIRASCSSSPTIFVCNMIVYVLMLRFPRLFGKRFHVPFFHWIHSIPQCIYLYNFIFFNYGLCASFLQLTYRYCLQNINPIPCCLSPWLPKPPLAHLYTFLYAAIFSTVTPPDVTSVYPWYRVHLDSAVLGPHLDFEDFYAPLWFFLLPGVVLCIRLPLL